MRDPFFIDEPTSISFSGGRTSAYMLWRVLQAHGGKLPPEAIVLFANTGKEHENTLRFVERCSQEWGVDIHWLEYQNAEVKFKRVDFDTAARNGEPFEALIRKKKYLPNPIARFCTSEMKVLTIERYMKSLGISAFETMVGIRADEQRRVAKLRSQKLTPLVAAGVTQADVQKFWSENKFDLELTFADGKTALGNCDLCFLKGAGQIKELIQKEPDRAVWWASMEQIINGTFRNDRPKYADLLGSAKITTDEPSIECFCGD